MEIPVEQIVNLQSSAPRPGQVYNCSDLPPGLSFGVKQLMTPLLYSYTFLFVSFRSHSRLEYPHFIPSPQGGNTAVIHHLPYDTTQPLTTFHVVPPKSHVFWAQRLLNISRSKVSYQCCMVSIPTIVDKTLIHFQLFIPLD